MKIGKVGVVGAGVMGSGIAALVASAGHPVILLDVPGDDERDPPARRGLQRAATSRPPAFMSKDRVGAVETGNVRDDLARLSDCDWIVEAIAERPQAKRELLEKLEGVAKPTAIVSSNTSSIPIRDLAVGRSAHFRARFLGTHFFNPPRYLHLLELIPTSDTAPDVLAAMRAFGDRRLGKGVVVAKDVPGFIANRLGVRGLVCAIRLMQELDLSIEQVDFLTGTFTGRQKAATFRTADISGLDVVANVAEELAASTGEDFALPEWLRALVASGRLGAKTGAGLYRKLGDRIEVLDWRTGDYAPTSGACFAELAYLQRQPLEERLRGIMVAGGRGAEFARRLLLEASHYTLSHAPEISPDIVSVDRAMEWGYAWELGPFRQMDAIGIDFLRGGLSALGLAEPPLLRAAQEGFYRHLGTGARQLTLAGEYVPIEERAGEVSISTLRGRGRAIESSEDAALVDLGDGVLLLEFTSKLNTMGAGVMDALRRALDRVAQGRHCGLVVANDDPRAFSAGADLAVARRLVESGDWRAIEDSVRGFQETILAVREAPFPVVVAPFGIALGGATELCLYADQVQAHAELVAGLVEVGVGIIPSGGGTTALLFRFAKELEPYAEADPFEAVKRAFGLIANATTSTSALEARSLGLLRSSDRITMNRARLVADAKSRVLDLAPDYAAPLARSIRALGSEAIGNLEYGLFAMKEAGRISDHDVLVGRKLAYVLAGGDGSPREVREREILELEREATLSLLGTKETQARIAHMLETGKPLRN